MKSNVKTAVAEQGQLRLVRSAGRVAVPAELVFAQPSLMAAINLCISASGLEEKEIYIALEIDQGHWTRMRKGEAHFPLNKLNPLMDLCGNEAPLMWLAHSRGQGLVMLKSESERMLAERDAEIEQLKTKLAHWEEFAKVTK